MSDSAGRQHVTNGFPVLGQHTRETSAAGKDLCRATSCFLCSLGSKSRTKGSINWVRVYGRHCRNCDLSAHAPQGQLSTRKFAPSQRSPSSMRREWAKGTIVYISLDHISNYDGSLPCAGVVLDDLSHKPLDASVHLVESPPGYNKLRGISTCG